MALLEAQRAALLEAQQVALLEAPSGLTGGCGLKKMRCGLKKRRQLKKLRRCRSQARAQAQKQWLRLREVMEVMLT